MNAVDLLAEIIKAKELAKGAHKFVLAAALRNAEKALREELNMQFTEKILTDLKP